MGKQVSIQGKLWRLAFWACILVSCLWLAVTIALAVIAIRQTTNGETPLGWNIFTLITFIRVSSPLFVAALMAWAVSLSKSGRPVRVTVRVFVPLLTAPLFYADTALLYSWFEYHDWRHHTGSMSYACGLNGSPSDIIGGRELILTEHRHMEGASSWDITRPGKKPVDTTAFPYEAEGFGGGSQGIKWREEGGRIMTAFLSFSDATIEYWPSEVWAILV